eukprot:gb/GEZJ01004105.1/.p1 GENE.gb/GEZJ01004105.1/~~gb/GEZJ01004105.1/.p1  ORF type:complete len:272 (+),score=13.47 gb/GEZJ01004105.1/:1403-2218(+)
MNEGKSKWTLEEVFAIARSDQNRQERYLLQHVDGRHRYCRWPELVAIAGRAIAEWCRARPGRGLEHGKAARLGLYQHMDGGEEWKIDAVIYVPHDTVLRSERGVLRVSGPAYYARNHDEPEWGWHQVHLYTVQGIGLANALSHQGIWHGRIGCTLEHDAHTDSYQIEPTCDASVIDALDSYCYRYPLVPVRVSSPGARPSSECTSEHELRGDRIIVCKTAEVCLQASLANAISEVIGEEYAREVMLNPVLPVMLSSKARLSGLTSMRKGCS